MATTKVTTDVIDMSGNAGGLTWVTGTTVQQPSGVIGEIREDTDTNRTLVYTDETGTAEWRNLKEAALQVPFNISYLVVAGAGGAGGGGGGGGAGGLLTNFGGTALSISSGTYDIEVGPGGNGGVSRAIGSIGSNSEFNAIISTGGGGGAGFNANTGTGLNGGSGGGGANSPGNEQYIIGGTATPSGQGNAGGRGYRTNDGFNACAGGGGAGGDGGDGSGVGSTPVVGAAGAALTITIMGGSGSPYAAGGIGSAEIGSGGGSGAAGSPNTGNGGNGTNSVTLNDNGGAGGSGIVILRCTKASASFTAGVFVNGVTTSAGQSVNGDTTNMPAGDYFYKITTAASGSKITFS